METVKSHEKNGTRRLKLEITVAGSEIEFEWQMAMTQSAAAMHSDTVNMNRRSADNDKRRGEKDHELEKEMNSNQELEKEINSDYELEKEMNLDLSL
ncbi:hypothetical protein QYF36_011408 [Acer negundo]|nr:hypothetical protein QYF36_011408 [Acer negundo]